MKEKKLIQKNSYSDTYYYLKKIENVPDWIYPIEDIELEYKIKSREEKIDQLLK